MTRNHLTDKIYNLAVYLFLRIRSLFSSKKGAIGVFIETSIYRHHHFLLYSLLSEPNYTILLIGKRRKQIVNHLIRYFDHKHLKRIVIGGTSNSVPKCLSYLITDVDIGASAKHPVKRLTYHYYTSKPERYSIFMPYFINTEANIYFPPFLERATNRGIRLFFAGSCKKSYESEYHFPGMNRLEIIERLIGDFPDYVYVARTRSELDRFHDEKPILLVLSDPDKDDQSKHILSTTELIDYYKKTDFFLSPPGVAMPHSHNMIEAMFCGAIPVTNYNHLFFPPLLDMVQCISFSDHNGLHYAVARCLQASRAEIGVLREKVFAYCVQHLTPESFLKKIESKEVSEIICNDEKESINSFVNRERTIFRS